MRLESNYCPGTRDAALQRLFARSFRGLGNGLSSGAIILTDENHYIATGSNSDLWPVLLMVFLLLGLMGVTWTLLSLYFRKGASLKKIVTLLRPTGTRIISVAHKGQPGKGPSTSVPANMRPVAPAVSLNTPHHPPVELKILL